MSFVLQVDAIRIDGGTQSRAGTNGVTVYEYANAMREGELFPPIVVFHDGEHYWLADGFHRLAATKEAGFKEIVCEVQQGTQRDAVLYSVAANSTHGLRRTNADKRRAVETLLKDEEWGKWSDREIARKCGVSQPFVGNIRQTIPGDNGYHLNGRIGADGKTYTTRHWAEVTPMAFWDKVKKYGLRNPDLPSIDILGQIQKGATKATDLNMSKDEALEALRKLAIEVHKIRFDIGGYVRHTTGKFGLIKDILADVLDVLDFQSGMQSHWQIDGCIPATKEEWEESVKQADQAKPAAASVSNIRRLEIPERLLSMEWFARYKQLQRGEKRVLFIEISAGYLTLREDAKDVGTNLRLSTLNTEHGEAVTLDKPMFLAFAEKYPVAVYSDPNKDAIEAFYTHHFIIRKHMQKHQPAAPAREPVKPPDMPPTPVFKVGNRVHWGKGLGTHYGTIKSINAGLVDIETAYGTGSVRRKLSDLTLDTDPQNAPAPEADTEPEAPLAPEPIPSGTLPPLPWLYVGNHIVAADGTQLLATPLNDPRAAAIARFIVESVNQALVTA